MENEYTNKKRSDLIDVMKGIAIYLVVLGHLFESVEYQNYIYQFIVCCHMPVFFLLAGYCSYHAVIQKNRLFNIISKMKSLLLPFVMWSLVSLIANSLLLAQQQNTTAIYKNFIETIIYARSVWFFLGLFISFVIVICVGYENKFFMPICIVIWIFMICFFSEDLLALGRVKRFFPCLVIGIELFKHKDIVVKWEKKYHRYLNKMMLAIYPVVVYGIWKYSYWYGIIAGVLGIIWIYYIADRIVQCEFVSHCIKDVGRYTMDVYVMHMFLVKFIKIIPRICMENGMILMGYFIVEALVITGVCWIISKYLLRKSKIYNRIFLGKF